MAKKKQTVGKRVRELEKRIAAIERRLDSSKVTVSVPNISVPEVSEYLRHIAHRRQKGRFV